MQYSDLEYLSVPLPEDVEKLKWGGDFDCLDRVLSMRIGDPDIPTALRKRLELERDAIKRIPDAYPYSREEALSILRAEIRDFRDEELDVLRDAGAIDWIYLCGRLRFKDDFLANLIKTRPAYEVRVINQERLSYKRLNFAELDKVISEMKDQGFAARRYRIRHSMRVKPEYERHGRELCVHLPLPVEVAPVTDFHLISSGPCAPYVSAPNAPQRSAFFRTKLKPGMEFFVEYEFSVRSSYVVPVSSAVSSGQPTFFLNEQPPHIRFTPLIRETAREIVGDAACPLEKARRIYDFFTTRPIYSYVRSYFTISTIPEYMLSSMKGDCGVFALSFITLCRSVGIPARWQSGLYCAPYDVGCHDWAEFFVAPYGWLPVDCSFGNAAYHAGSEERRAFYFGNLDPYRLPTTTEFQHPFDPPKRFLRSDPYDNQNGEAEYDDIGLLSSQFIERPELISWEKLI